jgi:hypothetical protein
LYYGAAVLLPEGCADDAVQGLGGFLVLREPKALARIAMRLVHLSAELPESSGQQAVVMLLDALRDRVFREAPEQELRVLIRAVRQISGYDTVLVDYCATLLATGEGAGVEGVITEILRCRQRRMLEDGAVEKADRILSYIEAGSSDHTRVRQAKTRVV